MSLLAVFIRFYIYILFLHRVVLCKGLNKAVFKLLTFTSNLEIPRRLLCKGLNRAILHKLCNTQCCTVCGYSATWVAFFCRYDII